MTYFQDGRQGYYQFPATGYPSGYDPQSSQQQVQQFDPYSLGYNSNMSIETMTQNTIEQSKYVHGRNRSRHLGLSPSQQRAFEEQKYQPNRSRYSSSSQETNPYALATPALQNTNPYARAGYTLANVDLFQYQHGANNDARNFVNAYYQQAHWNALLHQQMQPRSIQKVGEGVWEMMMPNGNAQYWYEPRPFVLRAEAAEYVPLNARMGLVVAAGPVVVVGGGGITGADDGDSGGEVGGEVGGMVEDVEVDGNQAIGKGGVILDTVVGETLV